MTVTKPPITVVGTNGQNIWRGTGKHKQFIVAHVMAGTLAGCDGWFSDVRAQASANYGVGKGGTIHQYVNPEGADSPYANGIVASPDADALALINANPGVNLNDISVSIEHEGQSGDLLTPAQLAASSQLCAWLCQRFGIPADEQHILGHYEIDSVSRAHCPGWDRAGWVRYVGAVQAALGGAPVPVPVPAKPHLTDADRLQLVAFVAGGSGVADLTAWLAGYTD